MSVDLQFVCHTTYLECIVTGNFELEEAKRAMTRLLREAAERRLPKLLIDSRRLVVTKPISFRERFDFAQHAARAALRARAHGLKVTHTVFLGGGAHIDVRRIGVTIAANRGVTVRSTTDEAEAFVFLGIEETEKHDPEGTTTAGG